MESLSDIAAEYEFGAAQRVVARVNRSACDTPAVDVGEHCPQVIDGPMVGDGFGKPMGILNPAAGIPICETAPRHRPESLAGRILSPCAGKSRQIFKTAAPTS